MAKKVLSKSEVITDISTKINDNIEQGISGESLAGVLTNMVNYSEDASQILLSYGSADHSLQMTGEVNVTEGDVINTYVNDSVSMMSVTLGIGNSAGIGGWKYNAIRVGTENVDFYLTDNTNVTEITINPEEEPINYDLLSGFTKGDKLSLIIKGVSYNDVFTIVYINDSDTAINGNKISISREEFNKVFGDEDLETAFNGDGIDSSINYSLFCLAKPFHVNYNSDIGRAASSIGIMNTANNLAANASGYKTNAYGMFSTTEGRETKAGYIGHAEGYKTTAEGEYSHTEGYDTFTIGESSHAEGQHSRAEGITSHAEGNNTTATGNHSHTEGSITNALGENSHAEGYDTSASKNNSHAEGQHTQAIGVASHTEGNTTISAGEASHAEGSNNNANGDYTHVEGNENRNNAGVCNHIEGKTNIAYGNILHVGGQNNKVSLISEQIGENGTHTYESLNDETLVSEYSYIVGTGNKVGKLSSSDSNCSTIFNSGSNNVTLSSVASFIIGSNNVSKGLLNSIVSGATNTQNTVSNSIISGQNNTITETNGSAVFGYENTVQNGKYVLISGHGNIVTNEGECAVGNYNKHKEKDTLFSVGIGTGPNNRNSGIEVRNTGEVYINYTQIDDNNPNQILFASCDNINKLTFKDQTSSPGVKIEYMSIQHIIDWLACRVNNLYDNIDFIPNDKWGGVLCLNLGNTMEENTFNEAVSALQSVVQNQKHYLVSVYDTVSKEYYGDCEVLYESSGIIRIINNKISSTLSAYSIVYSFNINNNSYSRNLYSIKIASASSVDKISTKVSELEGKNTALETRIAELESIIAQMQNK